MPLNPAQQAAVSYLEGPLLVLAGPGTGKTQLLSSKVAYILEHTDADPSNILCITFTDSGADNMRSRLKTIIGHAADEVNIFTYHAFGTDLLARYRNYAAVPERTLDRAIDEVTQHKILRDLVADLPARDILKNVEISSLRETIQEAKTARLSAEDLAKIAEINQQDSDAISQLASAAFAALIPRDRYDHALATVYEPLLADLVKFTSEKPITGSIERTANLLARELSALIDEQSAADKPSVAPFTKWRNRRFERTASGDYRLKDYIANRKLASLARLMSAYDAKLRESGQYDFADMIEEAITALKTDRGFRLTLSEQYQYILLDEFQDTNPSQFELIKLLTDYDQPQVMAVGDDDQAIFAFQGANASNLIDFRDYYDAHVITLTDNYRSTGAILDFSHQLADQLDESFAKKHQINKVLRSMPDLWRAEQSTATQSETSTSTQSPTSAANTITPTFPALARHEFPTASDEYYWIARQIRQLIDQGVPGPEIAVIAPKHKYIAPILPYLRGQHLTLAYEKSSDLLTDPVLSQLITIAEFVYELSQERTPSHLLLEILTYPFFGIKPADALSIFDGARYNHRAPLDFLRSADRPELTRLADWFADLVAASYDTPLDLWLSYLIGQTELNGFTSPFLTYYADHTSEASLVELYQNLNTLRRTVRDHLTSSQPRTQSPATLQDFIATINDYRAAATPIKHTDLYAEGSNAVQVMSAHKSKGLEFEYVFMVAVDELAWGRAKGNNNLFALPSNLLRIRHTGTTDDERLRLLFVAATRAKQHLIMTNSVTDFFGKTPARLSFLNEIRTDPKEPQLSPLLSPDLQRITLHSEPDPATRLTAAEQSWTAAFRTPDPELRQLFRQRLEHYRLTATDLTTFLDLINAGPEAIYRRLLLRAPDEPLNLNLAYGNLIHQTFERVTRDGLSDNDALAYFHDQAKTQPLISAELRELQERGSHDLPIALQSFRAILRADPARAEVNFPGESLTAAGVPIGGKIDHINLYPDTKSLTVYDFKTGNYHPEKWSSHPTLYRYSLQLGFYKLLLAASREYRNYQVTEGHILFVAPDPDGYVHDRAFEFTPETESELLDLIYAVYHVITSLDFIDDPELFLPADKSHTMRHLRAFTATLTERYPRPTDR